MIEMTAEARRIFRRALGVGVFGRVVFIDDEPEQLGGLARLRLVPRLKLLARQLDQLGYELIECLDAEGSPVGLGQRSPSPWLHYVARPVTHPETGPHLQGDTG